MKTFTREDYNDLMHSIQVPMIISGTVFEITNHALYYSILLVPYMNGPNDPQFVAVRLYKNDPDVLKGYINYYDWIKFIEPYYTLELEVKRVYDSYHDNTHIRFVKVWSTSTRSSIPVQYCPVHDSFNFLMDKDSPLQCCAEPHKPIITYTPILTRNEYLANRKEDYNEDI